MSDGIYAIVLVSWGVYENEDFFLFSFSTTFLLFLLHFYDFYYYYCYYFVIISIIIVNFVQSNGKTLEALEHDAFGGSRKQSIVFVQYIIDYVFKLQWLYSF